MTFFIILYMYINFHEYDVLSDVWAFQCTIGFWGANCTNKCDCGIHGNGSDLATGACQCQPGFIGRKLQF